MKLTFCSIDAGITKFPNVLLIVPIKQLRLLTAPTDIYKNRIFKVKNICFRQLKYRKKELGRQLVYKSRPINKTASVEFSIIFWGVSTLVLNFTIVPNRLITTVRFIPHSPIIYLPCLLTTVPKNIYMSRPVKHLVTQKITIPKILPDPRVYAVRQNF